MKKKEIIYHNTDGKMAKEKLMLMFNENGHVRIDEADYTALYKNIEEFYHWALQGKKIYKEWMNCQKIWGLKCDIFINVKKKQISLNLMVKKKLYFLNIIRRRI